MAALTELQRLPGDWDGLAARARSLRRAKAAALYAFLIAVSLPIILPYFWLVTIAFSAKTGVADTIVLWRSTAVFVPTVIAFWLAAILAQNRRQMWLGITAIGLIAAAAFALLVGPDLHPRNFIFLVEPDFASVVRSRSGVVRGAVQFPSVWKAFGNSLLIAGAQTLIVLTVASLAAYYLSRFQFPARAAMLRSLLALHAFPVLTLIVPMFLMLYRIGLLDTLFGVILVLVAFERRSTLGHRDERVDRRRVTPSGLPSSGVAPGPKRAPGDRCLHVYPRLGRVHFRVYLPDPQYQLDHESLHVLRPR